MHNTDIRIGGVSLRKLLIGLVIVIAVLFSAKAVMEYAQELPAPGKYQAVFLTNGQVYFGKLSSLGGSYVILKDVYLVQSQGTAANPNVNPSPSPEPQLTLSRIDQNSLIKPEQEMTIAKSSILFWENMQDSAEVVKKIEGLKKKK